VFEWENRVNVDNQMSYVVFMQIFLWTYGCWRADMRVRL
jgi:hypothetical protein